MGGVIFLPLRHRFRQRHQRLQWLRPCLIFRCLSFPSFCRIVSLDYYSRERLATGGRWSWRRLCLGRGAATTRYASPTSVRRRLLDRPFDACQRQ